LGREAVGHIIGPAAQAPRQWRPLSSNVRHRTTPCSSRVRVVHRRSVVLALSWSRISLPNWTPSTHRSRRRSPRSEDPECLQKPTSANTNRSRRRLSRNAALPCRAFGSASCPPTDSSPHLRRPSSGSVLRCPLYSARWSPGSSLPRTPLPQAPEPNEPRAVVMPEQCRPNHLSFLRGTRALPNPSLERTSTGVALGPRSRGAYHRPRGPSATPLAAAQLKR
jgi:hypothetical protein